VLCRIEHLNLGGIEDEICTKKIIIEDEITKYD